MKTKAICSYCGKFLGWIDTPSGGVSHGLCEACFHREMKKAEEELRENGDPEPLSHATSQRS